MFLKLILGAYVFFCFLLNANFNFKTIYVQKYYIPSAAP